MDVIDAISRLEAMPDRPGMAKNVELRDERGTIRGYLVTPRVWQHLMKHAGATVSSRAYEGRDGRKPKSKVPPTPKKVKARNCLNCGQAEVFHGRYSDCRKLRLKPSYRQRHKRRVRAKR